MNILGQPDSSTGFAQAGANAVNHAGGGGGGVYWTGHDGNLWVKDSRGVHNYGDASQAGSYVNAGVSQGGYQQINNPSDRNVLGDSTTTTPNNPNGTTGAAPKVLNQSGIDNTQKTIDEIPGLLKAALAAEDVQYGNATGGLDAQQADQQQVHDSGIVTNQQNYDANYMDSIRAGMKGLSGLMSLLRGTGAGGGTAEDIARNTVGGVTADDIRTGADTQKENATSLDSGLSAFLTNLKQKRTEADVLHENNHKAITRDSNTQLQKLFGTMAGYYGDVGDTGNKDTWMNKAGSLTHDIATDSKAAASPYDFAPVPVASAPVSSFAAPTQPSVVTAPGGQVGSGIFSMSDTRKKRETPVAVPVGV